MKLKLNAPINFTLESLSDYKNAWNSWSSYFSQPPVPSASTVPFHDTYTEANPNCVMYNPTERAMYIHDDSASSVYFRVVLGRLAPGTKIKLGFEYKRISGTGLKVAFDYRKIDNAVLKTETPFIAASEFGKWRYQEIEYTVLENLDTTLQIELALGTFGADIGRNAFRFVKFEIVNTIGFPKQSVHQRIDSFLFQRTDVSTYVRNGDFSSRSDVTTTVVEETGDLKITFSENLNNFKRPVGWAEVQHARYGAFTRSSQQGYIYVSFYDRQTGVKVNASDMPASYYFTVFLLSFGNLDLQ